MMLSYTSQSTISHLEEYETAVSAAIMENIVLKHSAIERVLSKAAVNLTYHSDMHLTEHLNTTF